MFLLEICVFILFLGGCFGWALGRDMLAERRDRKQARRINEIVHTLPGKPIAGILQEFGAPFEQYAGASGHSLFVWKAPPSTKFPPFRGVLVVTVTTSEDGVVHSAVWRRQ